MRSLFILLTTGVLATAADDTPKKELTRSEKIQQALQQRKDLDLKSQPLSKALEAITELTGVRIERDPTIVTVMQPGFPIEPEIALKGDKTAVGATLAAALAPQGLTWVVLGERVVVTTFERAVSLQMQQRITLEVSGTPLSQVFGGLAREHGVNIVLDAQVAKEGETKIDLRLKGASLESAVIVLAANAGLHTVRVDSLLYVTTQAKAQLLKPKLAPAPAAVPPTGMFGVLGVIGVAGNFGGQLGQVGGGPVPKKAPPAKLGEKSSFSGASRHGLLRLLLAAPVPTKKETAEETPAEKVRKQLDKLVSVDLMDRKLTSVIKELEDKTGVKIVTDLGAINRLLDERNGDDFDDLTVTLKVDKEPIKQVLRQVLAEHELGFVVLGGRVLVTTQALMTQRVARQIVNVDANKTTLADALRKLSRETSANIVLDSKLSKEGQEKVTLQLEDVSLEAAVKLLAEEGGLRAVVFDGVFYVTTRANAAELREETPRPAARERRR